jgi:hypothetical protein
MHLIFSSSRHGYLDFNTAFVRKAQVEDPKEGDNHYAKAELDNTAVQPSELDQHLEVKEMDASKPGPVETAHADPVELPTHVEMATGDEHSIRNANH